MTMAIRIGHASIDENGKAKGGSAGDQSGKEVCIRNWYNKPWSVLLRPKDEAVAEKMAQACEAGCANNNIGYDQNQRNTLHTLLKQNGYDMSSVGKCETDCSAFMTVCAVAGGVMALEYDGNAPTTSNMRAKFTATGAFDCLTDSKYLTKTDFLRRGDILVAPGKHTVMVLDDGANAKKTSDKTSDSGQNGNVLLSITDIQKWAGTDADGVYGPKTRKAVVKKAQTAIGTSADGIWGSKSNKAWKNLRKGSSGEAVKAVQAMLICRGFYVGPDGADGEYGQNTTNAVSGFQSCAEIEVDGITGRETAGKLFQ